MLDMQDSRATARIESDVQMLNTYLAGPDIAPLIEAMEALAGAPRDATHRADVEAAFSGLGIQQGAVLTYAPYLAEVFAADLFNNAPEPAPISDRES